MTKDYSGINFHEFVEKELAAGKYKLLRVTKDVMVVRLPEIMQFVNTVRLEFKEAYDWQEESEEYFLRDMVDKWKYSFGIVDQNDEICLLNFSSVYGDLIHYHFIYTKRDLRGSNLAKLHFVKLNQVCIENGFKEMELFCPKNNNRGILLYLRLGWVIQSMRNNKELLMRCNLERVRNEAYELLLSGKKVR